jgi:hypothetical protein
MGILGSLKKFGRWADPTKNKITGALTFGVGGMAAGKAAGLWGGKAENDVGLEAAQRAATGDVDFMRGYGGKIAGNIEGHDFEAAAKKASASLAGPYDQQVADDAYAAQVEPIDQAKFTAARGAADAYGRRGLGASGMAAGAQGDVELQASAQ